MDTLPGQTILSHYQALEVASQEMLRAAQAGEWDRVRQLEETCASVIARLRMLKKAQPLTAQERPERLRILQSILANDARIRSLAQPLPGFLDDAGVGVSV